MRWLYLREVYHNSSNINKIKINEDVTIWFKEDTSPTTYYNITQEELIVINQFLNNDNTTDS